MSDKDKPIATHPKSCRPATPLSAIATVPRCESARTGPSRTCPSLPTVASATGLCITERWSDTVGPGTGALAIVHRSSTSIGIPATHTPTFSRGPVWATR